MRDASAEVLTAVAESKSPGRMSRSKQILFAVKILLTVFLIAYILHKHKDDLPEFTNLLANLNWGLFWTGVSLGGVFNILKFYKWHFLLRSRGVESTFFDAFVSYALGSTVGVVTPGRAGELARALYFSDAKRKPVLGLVVYDRILDVCAMFILGIPGAFLVQGIPVIGGLSLMGIPVLGMSVVAMAIVLIILGFHSGVLSWTWRKIKQWTGRKSGIGEFRDMVTRKQAAWALFISLLAFGLVLVQMYVFIGAFQPVSATGVGLAMPLVILSNLIPITHLGLGVRETVAQETLKGYGVEASVSIFCAFLIFVINTLLLALVGVFYIGRIRLGRNGDKSTGKNSLPDSAASSLDS